VVRFLVSLSDFFFSKSSIMALELLFNFKHSREFCNRNNFLCACVKLHGLRVRKPTNSTGPRIFDNNLVVIRILKTGVRLAPLFSFVGNL